MIRKLWVSYIVLISLVLSVVWYPAEALTSWKFYFPVTVTDTGGAERNNLPVISGLTGSAFTSTGYMTATGTDTAMQLSGTDAQYMLSTTNIPFVVSNLPANGSRTYNFYTGASPVKTEFPVVLGVGANLTTADNAALLMVASGSIEWYGLLDATRAGAVLLKRQNLPSNNFNPIVYLPLSGNLTAYSDLGVNWSLNSAITSGTTNITLGWTGGVLTLYINSVAMAVTPAVGLVAAGGYPFIWINGDCFSYIYHIKYTVDGVEKIYYGPPAMITSTTLPNNYSGGAYPGTITWGTNTNLNITYGAMVASVGAVAGSTNQTEIGFNPPSFALPAGWNNTGNESSQLPFGDVMSQLRNAGGLNQGMTAQTGYMIAFMALALILMVWMTAVTKHALLGMAVLFVVMMIGYNTTIIAGWFIFSVVVMSVTTMFLMRQYG